MWLCCRSGSGSGSGSGVVAFVAVAAAVIVAQTPPIANATDATPTTTMATTMTMAVAGRIVATATVVQLPMAPISVHSTRNAAGASHTATTGFLRPTGWKEKTPPSPFPSILPAAAAAMKAFGGSGGAGIGFSFSSGFVRGRGGGGGGGFGCVDAFFSSPSRASRQYHGTSALRINRFLLDPSEIDDDGGEEDVRDKGGSGVCSGGGGGGEDEAWSIPTATLLREDYRTVHAAKVLGLVNGDTLRAGVVGTAAVCVPSGEGTTKDQGGGAYAGLITDVATVEWLPEGRNRKPVLTRNGDPPGSLRIYLRGLRPPEGGKREDVTSFCSPSTPGPPSVSLLLALPRPLQLSRILPMISQVGVDHLVLTGANKVPKDYFGSHLFREPNEMRRLLVEGLCQAGDVRLPSVTVVRSLKKFLEDDLERMFPREQTARVICHPQRAGEGEGEGPIRIREVQFPPQTNLLSSEEEEGKGENGALSQSWRRRQSLGMLLAVGPEGGWAEPYELDLFQEHGFRMVTLGTRVLRSDVAVVGLLTLAHDVCVARAAATEEEEKEMGMVLAEEENIDADVM